MQQPLVSSDITLCSKNDFLIVKKLISDYCLDDNDLQPEQFLIAVVENKIAGFGRLRNYSVCSELCSLGVVEELRLKGIGSLLSHSLIAKNQLPLYTVTIIPEFFEKFGFKLTESYPIEIEQKVKYCTSVLSVPEKYVVMKK